MNSRLNFYHASTGDDMDIRRRLREDIMPGDVSVSFRREPSYFRGCQIMGYHSDVMACRDTVDDKFVGFGVRHHKNVFLNGEQSTAGYLADLRCDPRYRKTTFLSRGFRFFKKYHAEKPLPLYYSLIYGKNQEAESNLTGSRAGLPSYVYQGRVQTPALHLDFAKPVKPSRALKLENPNTQDLQDVCDFSQRCLRDFQLGPVYTPEVLEDLAAVGLDWRKDVWVMRDKSEIVACAYLWSQQSYRQMHVEGYTPWLHYARPLYNAASKFSALKPLPQIGMPLNCIYLGMLAVKDHDSDLFEMFLQRLYQVYRRTKYHFMIVGFPEGDQRLDVIGLYRRVNSGGKLFYIDYNDGTSIRSQLDQRSPYVEIACL